MADNIIELTPFRADMIRALTRRGQRLLNAVDLAEEVATLEPLESYYIVKEVGMDQALPILRLLDRQQLRTCIDLDCWNRNDFDADSLAQWLLTFAQAGPETLASGFFSLDYVVQLLFLTQTITVYDPDTDLVPPEDMENVAARAMTPDGFYLLELKLDIPLKIHPFTVLDALYQYDPTATHGLLSEIRVDPQTQIEEEGLRFRNDRLQDIGFVPADEATKLFSPPSLQQPSVQHRKPLDRTPSRLPSLYAGPLSESSLLQQALSLISDPEWLASLEQEIIWTINRAIIAYGEKAQDIEEISSIAERVRDTLSLGLEALLAQQAPDCLLDDARAAEEAAALLNSWSITDLFRHGFAATQALQHEARQALKKPRFDKWYRETSMNQSDEPADRLDRAFIAALLKRHPLRGGYDLAKPDTIMAFSCLADVNVARVRLQRVIDQICNQP